MTLALGFTDVVKSYGNKRALDGLSFEVPVGGICGFVGPNGAGKTTTFSVVSGFLAPDSGSLEILGLPAFDPWKLKGRLGVLPQDAELSDRHTPLELCTHLARLQGMSARESAREAARVLDVVRLGDRASSWISGLSHGMRRRVAVATALLGSPELVLLDEPMAGLDPLQARSLRAALAELRGRQTLIVSSHDLDELERLCDHVVMIDRGRCLRQGPMTGVTGQATLVQWLLSGPAPLEALQAALPEHRFVESAEGLAQHAPAASDLDQASVAIMRVLAESGVGVRAVRRGKALESQFLEDAEKGG